MPSVRGGGVWWKSVVKNAMSTSKLAARAATVARLGAWTRPGT
ncbi:hypothetical protein O4158_20980 [Gordonia amicalis]|nr:hypothetical protein [Gordonia amicalis]MCZ4581514.1 hypothetical protein [Gordonia amicalis]